MKLFQYGDFFFFPVAQKRVLKIKEDNFLSNPVKLLDYRDYFIYNKMRTQANEVK